MFTWECGACRVQRRGYQNPRIGVAGNCGSPSVGAGNQALVLNKSSSQSWLLSHFSSPYRTSLDEIHSSFQIPKSQELMLKRYVSFSDESFRIAKWSNTKKANAHWLEFSSCFSWPLVSSPMLDESLVVLGVINYPFACITLKETKMPLKLGALSASPRPVFSTA